MGRPQTQTPFYEDSIFWFVVICNVLYAILLVTTLALFALTRIKKLDLGKISFMFTATICTFFVFRVLWLWSLMESKRSWLYFAINRAALATFFTAFTIILFGWIDSLRGGSLQRWEGVGFLPRLKWAFIFANIIYYCFILITTIAFAATGGDPDDAEENTSYQVAIIGITVIDLVTAFSFLTYAVYPIGLSKEDKRVAQVRFVAVGFTLCFLVRVGMMLYRPITGEYLPKMAFYVCAYLFPELAPAGLQLFIQFKRIGYQLSQKKLAPWERASLLGKTELM